MKKRAVAKKGTTKKMANYEPAQIEKKWQKKWASSKLYLSKQTKSKKKYYVLDMFPYPSGEGLHVGHPKGYIATDVISRMKRMQGMNVLHPMGFDAFGLPAENYALKTKTHPEIAVKKNVDRYKKQLELLGFDYDWSREVNTTDPKYYKWTQWIFLQLWKKGLAFESFEPINWCPSCKTGLANEDIEDGRCERCGTPVEKKPLRQWVLKITDYADRLLEDLDLKVLRNGDYVGKLPNGDQTIMHMTEEVPGKIRPDKPFVPRHAIAAFVEHWSEDKFLALKWKKVPWITPITGGIEKGQTAEDAVRAEILEETGYKNIEIVKKSDEKIHSIFFHPPKDENRVGHFSNYLVKLKDGTKADIAKEELAVHEPLWLPRKEFRAALSAQGQKMAWDLLTKEANVFDDAKPLLDWPESIKELQRNWIGRSEGAQIDFKLELTSRKTRFVLIHGYKGSPDEDFLPWLKSEFEKKGHEVVVPRLPNTTEPTESEQVDFVLKNCKLDENTVVIGHSLGAVVALKAIMKHGKPISGLVLVAAASDPAHWVNKPRSFHKTFTWKYDYEQIKNLTGGRIAVLSDTKEIERSAYLKHLAKELSAGLIEVDAKGMHFTGAEEPAILDCCTPKVSVFTTRPDTIFGVTYLTLAPEHTWVREFLPFISNRSEVEAYVNRAKNETEQERTDATKDKTGVELKGLVAVNPANDEKVPVWISDYVLADYGTGAVMAVPAHDERDFEFAKKFNLPIKQVVMQEFGEKRDKEEFRDGVCVVAFDPQTQKYAVTKDEKGKFRLPSGGNDAGEDYKSAAIRELREETGLSDIKLIESVGEYETHYFHSIKNLNRAAHSMCYVVVLNSAKSSGTKLEDHEKFELAWATPEEIIKSWDAFKNHGVDHWFWLVNQAVGRLIELGYDKTSDPRIYRQISYTGSGKLTNSGRFNGRESDSVMKEITEFCGGKWVSKYKLRDWVFSRQRYWGEPIPLIHCEKCGVVAVPEKDLPVELPKVKSYEPTGTGESPLAAISKWVNVKCPECGGKGKRETNTMPQWAGSCWYYLRYEDPKNSKKLVDQKKEKYWSPVDLYVGGAEHATRHLIYARFWHKFLYDIGVASTTEPFKKLQSVGLIMGEDGRKMSKRFGNVVNPDEIVATYGADTLRLYEMFMGPFDQQIAWSTGSMIGARRFIERAWKMSEKVSGKGHIEKILHKTIKKVTEDIDNLRFNTAISSLMIAGNELEKAGTLSRETYEAYLKLIAPFAPHAAEELWHALGNKKSIHVSAWPEFDPNLVVDDEATIVVQVNGKVRGSFVAAKTAGKDELEAKAKDLPEVKKWTSDKDIRKIIVVPGRLVNIVV